MPQVGDRQFPYTPEGLEAARIYEEQLRGKMSPLNALTRATADRARRQQIVGPRPDRATSRIRQQTNPYRSMTQMIQNRPDRRGPSERLIEEFTRQRQRPVTVPRPNVPGTVWDERIPPELGGDASGQWRGRRPGIPVQNPDEWERGVRASYDKINEMMESLPPADRADPMKRRALLEAIKRRGPSDRLLQEFTRRAPSDRWGDPGETRRQHDDRDWDRDWDEDTEGRRWL